jgi:TMEM175 potassium channel family protein
LLVNTNPDPGITLQSSPPKAKSPGIGCRNFERIIALSDGIFAFAITLLALSLIVPVLTSGALENELAHDLLGMWPIFLSYFISFFVIASWWRSHHRTFSFITRCNSTLISLNFYFLLCITLIPFLTNLIMDYGHFALATVLYAAMQAIAGTIILVLWLYASKDHRLISTSMSAAAIQFNTHRQFLVIIIFLISIPIAFINTSLAQISWIAIMPVVMLLRRAYRDIEEFVEDEIETSGNKE